MYIYHLNGPLLLIRHLLQRSAQPPIVTFLIADLSRPSLFLPRGISPSRPVLHPLLLQMVDTTVLDSQKKIPLDIVMEVNIQLPVPYIEEKTLDKVLGFLSIL